eukprot:3716686-Amphidinium_carterae.1
MNTFRIDQIHRVLILAQVCVCVWVSKASSTQQMRLQWDALRASYTMQRHLYSCEDDQSKHLKLTTKQRSIFETRSQTKAAAPSA